MIIETSREYFSISSFLHRALKHFVAIWATLPRQLWRPEVWKSIATFTPTSQRTEMEFWLKNGRNFWMPGMKLLSCPCVTQSLYNLFNVTPSQSFVLRYASRQSLVPYGTLVIKAPRAWEQNVSQRQLVFCSFATVYSSFTRSHSLVRSITVFDSPNPDSLVSIIL